ncbi:tRNA (guanosine(37)-N1)-methyltransferase TrmD [Candidatus Gottesmanbacteria bacterium]|nr:tRNA (guanosine(37)-N1)-methyltransferase TrmD [Candidatus Gottesmanbacteria bacterium]
MKITILTLFPEIFTSPLTSSIVGRAQKKGLVSFNIINLRDFARDKHKSVDDHPYGGGAGMILRVDIIDRALSSFNLPASPAGGQPTTYLPRRQAGNLQPKTKVVLLDPRGKVFQQKIADKYSKLDHLVLICGHYEGVDERVTALCDDTISIGDFVLTGGELGALVIIDAVTRLIPGVISKDSTTEESFNPHLSYPQYTRPPIYKRRKVPEILLSGDHKKIKIWREQKSLETTKKNRPDLLK